MKRHYLAAILAVMCIALAHADVVLDETHFPDANFRAFITEKTGVAEGGTITDDIIAKQTDWNPSRLEIKTLNGIEYFTSLTSLNCSDNQLESLDVTSCTQLTTLNCLYNYITSLDVTKNTQLTTLKCNSNKLSSLDVTKNTQLTTFDCGSNYIPLLDVTKCAQLTYLRCSENQISSLDVTKCTQLKELYCIGNQLSSLDVSNCTQLTRLDCDKNKLSSLDVTKCTQLTRLRCTYNKIKSLDIRNCRLLEDLAVFKNNLLQLNLNNQGYGRLFDFSPQYTEIPVKSYTDIDGKKKYMITMPDDFVNNKSEDPFVQSINYIKEIKTPGVTSEIIDGVTYFYYDAENRLDKITYEYSNKSSEILVVNLIPHYPDDVFSLSETHRSTFLINKELNTYKNAITLGNLIEKDDYTHDGATYTLKRTDYTGNSVDVAKVKLNLVGEQTGNAYYTYTVTYPEGSLANNVNHEDRWDNVATVNSGNLDDGAVVVDYFTESTRQPEDLSGRCLYIYSIKETPTARYVAVPVFKSYARPSLVSDGDTWVKDSQTYGYLKHELDTDADDEWNEDGIDKYHTPQGVVVTLFQKSSRYDYFHGDYRYDVHYYYDPYLFGDDHYKMINYYNDFHIDALNDHFGLKCTAYVNGEAIGDIIPCYISKYGCYASFESLPNASVPDGERSYRCGFSITVLDNQNGEIVENTYGTNFDDVGTVAISTTASDFTKSEMVFNGNSHYYKCLLSTKLTQSRDCYRIKGIRVWRDCKNADEESEELMARSQRHLFYKFFTDDYDYGIQTMQMTSVSGIGGQDSDPSIALGPETTNGVFGSNAEDDRPEVQYRVRVYYSGCTPYSTHHNLSGYDSIDKSLLHVAEDVITVKWPEDGIHTGIDGVDCDKQVKSVSYYNNLGQMSDKPFNGMNIIVTTYTDGSHSSTKMIK